MTYRNVSLGHHDINYEKKWPTLTCSVWIKIRLPCLFVIVLAIIRRKWRQSFFSRNVTIGLSKYTAYCFRRRKCLESAVILNTLTDPFLIFAVFCISADSTGEIRTSFLPNTNLKYSLWVLFTFNVHGSVHRNNIVIYTPTRCTCYRVYFIWQLLYMFRALLSPIFRST